MKKSLLALVSLSWVAGLATVVSVPFSAQAHSHTTGVSQGSATSRNTLVAQRRVRFNFPRVGAPGNREGGAARGGASCAMTKGKSLTPLLPPNNIGFTVSDYPTFFVHLPTTSSQVVEFVLMNDKRETVYKTIARLQPNPGIVSFSLPDNATLPPLAVGKRYQWQFSVICNPQDASSDLVVNGWVQRVAPEAKLLNDLQRATASDRPAIYAANGMWYDTLSALAELRRSNPKNSDFMLDWAELLKSAELGKIAEEPFFL